MVTPTTLGTGITTERQGGGTAVGIRALMEPHTAASQLQHSAQTDARPKTPVFTSTPNRINLETRFSWTDMVCVGKNHSSSVTVKALMPSFSSVKYGVPQGSVLGPILCIYLYIFPLGHMIQRYDVMFHFFAHTKK